VGRALVARAFAAHGTAGLRESRRRDREVQELMHGDVIRRAPLEGKQLGYSIVRGSQRGNDSMTLVAGFFCRDGLLMCADMEETTATSKRKLNKLFYRGINDWQIVFTGAGSAVVIDNAIKRLDDLIKEQGGTNFGESWIEGLINDVLYEVHENYVWKSQQVDHRVSLLIGYSEGASSLTDLKSQPFKQRLWVTDDIVPAPEVKYVCKGIGQDLANFFADRLYHPFYSAEQAAKLAAFIFKEVKQNVSGVGQGTTMWLLPKFGGQAKAYSDHTIAEIEKTLPDFDTTLKEYGLKITGPLFPAMEGDKKA
jgi:20S proteasome alpha/beta subunit